MSKSIVIALSLAALSGCAQGPKYEWGAYQHSMLAYYRAPAERPGFDRALDETIAAGEVKGNVPPGLYAEAGYEAISKGDTQKALAMFAKEKAAWPESKIFMDKAAAGANKASSAAIVAAPAS